MLCCVTSFISTPQPNYDVGLCPIVAHHVYIFGIWKKKEKEKNEKEKKEKDRTERKEKNKKQER